MVSRWVFTLAAACVAGPAAAANYTVSTSGSDSANGVNTPFRTLQKAAAVLRDGDSVTFKAGVYTGGCWIEGLSNVTLRGEAGAVIDGTNGVRQDGMSFYGMRNVTIEGINFRSNRRYGIFCVLTEGLTIRNCVSSGNGLSGFLTGNTSDVLVEGCSSSGNGEHGLYLSQSGDRLTVRRNVFFNNVGGGLQINAVQSDPVLNDATADSRSDNCLVDGNEIYGNGRLGGSAINLMGVRSSIICNNLLHDNLAGGIAMFDDGAGSSFGCKNNQIVHNTVLFAPGVGRYGVQAIAGSTGNQILNNILAVGAGPALDTDVPVLSNFNALAGTTIANGLSLASWRSQTGNDLNSFAGSAGLTADFRPAADSPARDCGQYVVDHDFVGAARPAGAGPDLGCFEADGTTNTPPPPANAGAAKLYEDGLTAGWTADARKASYSLTATRAVPAGTSCISLTITGVDGYIRFLGGSIPVAGRTYLKFRVHGGNTGGQLLRTRVIVDGAYRTSFSVRPYGGLPVAGTWKEYAIPLSDLLATSGNITGVTFTAGSAQPFMLIDDVRVE